MERAIMCGNWSRPSGPVVWIWQNKEPTGKPIPGSYEWTALSGKHKVLVLQKLPANMDTIFKDNLSAHFAKLWNVSMCYVTP